MKPHALGFASRERGRKRGKCQGAKNLGHNGQGLEKKRRGQKSQSGMSLKTAKQRGTGGGEVRREGIGNRR